MMDVESDTLSLNMFRFKPFRSDMLYYLSREQTYENWPKQMIQKPNELIQNGFYYTNIGDRVTCFYCGVTLKQWTKYDTVETEHLKWEPNCLYAKMVSSKVLNFDVTH